MESTGNSTDGRSLLRAQVSNSILYKIFNIVFGLFFSVVLVLVIFFNQKTFYHYKILGLVLILAAVTAITWVLAKIFMLLPKFSTKAETIIILIAMAIFITLQSIVGWQLRTAPNDAWDYGIVFQHARDFVLNGTYPGEYFLYFPNNTGLYTLWVVLFSVLKTFGAQDFYIGAFIFNIVSISTAIVLLYLCARHLFGVNKAFFVLFTAFATSPFLLYSSITYTDTVTLPYPIMIVLLWLKARNYWRKGQFSLTLLYFCALSAFAALGSVLKITVLIVWVAVAIDLIVLMCGKGRLRIALAGLGVLCFILFSGLWFTRNSMMLPKYNYKQDGIPYTNWIMMGLQGQGGYNDSDYQAVLSLPDVATRKQYIKDETSNRIEFMGPIGLIQHIGDKLSYTFGDGTYVAPDKLNRSSVQPSPLHNFVIYTEPGFKYFAYISFGINTTMLLFMMIASFKSLWRGNNSITFIRVAVFGLSLFLMIWETRSRYLINFLPLFLLCAAEALPVPLSKEARRDSRRKILEARAHKLRYGDDSLISTEAIDEALTHVKQGTAEKQQPKDLFAKDSDKQIESVWSYAGTNTLSGFEEQFLKPVPPGTEPVIEQGKIDTQQ